MRLPAAPFAAAAAVYRAVAAPFAPLPGIVDRLDFFLAERTYDVSKARRELGFEARVSLRDGIERTVASYRNLRLI